MGSELGSIPPVLHDGFSYGVQIVRIPFINTGSASQDETTPLPAHLNQFSAILLDLLRRAGDQQRSGNIPGNAGVVAQDLLGAEDVRAVEVPYNLAARQVFDDLEPVVVSSFREQQRNDALFNQP